VAKAPLIRRSVTAWNDGSILVVEFKTGRPSRAHQGQLDLYVDSATAIYSGARVEGRLVYVD
jgi:hypothetical protein